MYILQSSSAMTSGNFLFKSMELAPLNEEPRRFMQIFFPPSTRAHTFLIGRLQSRVELESNVTKNFMNLKTSLYFPIFSQNCHVFHSIENNCVQIPYFRKQFPPLNSFHRNMAVRPFQCQPLPHWPAPPRKNQKEIFRIIKLP